MIRTDFPFDLMFVVCFAFCDSDHRGAAQVSTDISKAILSTSFKKKQSSFNS